jgi:energy-coupling factor transport system permease protein
LTILIPGLHVPAETTIHRLDPRVKMCAVLVLTALPFAVSGLANSLALAVFLAVLVALSKVPVLSLLRTLRSVLWVGLFILVFHAFTVPGAAVLAIGSFTLTWEGLVGGLQQIYRLCYLVLVYSLLTYTTSPAQLSHGVETAFGPLVRVGLPIRELAMVLTIALRFVPILTEEVDRLVKAQESRGAAIRRGPVWARMRGWTAVFVPLFVAAFRRADELATAMDARGFRGTHTRTHLYTLRLQRRDLVAGLALLAFVALILSTQQYT